MEKKQHPKKEFIDFSKLSVSELNALSKMWEDAARVFEAKLDSYRRNPKANEEKVERLWGVGGALWRRVNILERWRLRHGKHPLQAGK